LKLNKKKRPKEPGLGGQGKHHRGKMVFLHLKENSQGGGKGIRQKAGPRKDANGEWRGEPGGRDGAKRENKRRRGTTGHEGKGLHLKQK